MTNFATQLELSQIRSPRILFVAEAVAISHVARPFLLATHLQRNGYTVRLARDPRYKRLFSEDNLDTVDLTSLEAPLVETRLARHDPIHDVEILDRYIQEDLRIIREFKPDVIVGDFRHSLAVSSQLVRVPYVNIAEAHWSPVVETQYELPNSPFSGLIGMPLSNLLFQTFQPLAFAYQTLPLNVIRMKYGLSAIGSDVKTCNTWGDYTIYPNDPELFLLHRPLPSNHTFIGPLLWSPSVEEPDWWNHLPPSRPIVYVSLGSTGNTRFLDYLLDVLELLPVTVMLATAARSKKRPIASNIFRADFLPGAEAAARARLVICNGGTMSGQQALSVGKPYLGLISNLDQMLFSMAVRRTGACELLREDQVNENSLRSTIVNMLNEEKYQSSAVARAARAARFEPCGRFEEIVSSILKEKFGDYSVGLPEAVQS